MLGLSPETRIGVRSDSGPEAVALDLSDPEEMVEMALAQRPDVLAALAQVDLAEKERRLASREAIPNLDFGSVIDRNARDAQTTYGLRLSLPIPIWNRNQGRREEARATEELRSIQLTELELRVRGEVLLAVESFRTATAELEILTANVLEPARENRALLQRAYEAGQMDLPTTLILQTQQIGAELSCWESWLRQRIALAELEAAVGEIPRTPSSTQVW
jgi:cobalt-zinc-cadmium efflux system outer membrane protein